MVEALHDYVDLPQALSSAKGVLGIGGGDKAE
jgi:membrane protein required for colicin V production